jgi:hypothetical protein
LSQGERLADSAGSLVGNHALSLDEHSDRHQHNRVFLPSHVLFSSHETWELLAQVFRNDGNWYFKFRVHESPFYRRSDGTAGVPEHISDTGWSVVEITGSSRDGQARHHRIRCSTQL